MVLLSVLLPMILAVSLATTSSPGSSMDLHLHSQKNASENWVIRVDAQRSIRSENERELLITVVHQQTRLSHNNEMEQVVSMTTVYLPLNDTSMPGAIERPTATNTTSTTTPKSCPDSGYEPYPGFSCYKAFPSKGEYRTWSEARATCREDGGDLMVIETEQERNDVYIPLRNSVNSGSVWHWVGVYIPQGASDWTTVKGQPALSTWWEPGEPEKNGAYTCALAFYTGQLANFKCKHRQPFICEISL